MRWIATSRVHVKQPRSIDSIIFIMWCVVKSGLVGCVCVMSEVDRLTIIEDFKLHREELKERIASLEAEIAQRSEVNRAQLEQQDQEQVEGKNKYVIMLSFCWVSVNMCGLSMSRVCLNLANSSVSATLITDNYCHWKRVVPNMDISLQSGRFWATSIASFRERLLDFRSCWIVFIHVVRGRPDGLRQLFRSSWHLFRLVFAMIILRCAGGVA